MSRIENLTLKSEFDGTPLSVLIVLPDGAPRALVQLAHGMQEHKERYLRFMEYLADQGFASIINDHRGHGQSLKSRDDLGYFGQDGARALVDDLHQLTTYFKARFPGKRLILFGHSMGALAVRCYCRSYDGDIDGLVVCGSPGANPAAKVGLWLNRVLTALKRERAHSPLFDRMSTGGYNKRFAAEGTNAWLSAEPENVKAYNADPLCGFPFTLNGYKALLELLRDTYAPFDAQHPALPVRFISGADDPCAPDAKGFENAMDVMRRAGYRSVTGKLYSGMRHEILNEAGREQVYAELAQWLDSII